MTILPNNHKTSSEQLQGGKNSADCSVKVLIWQYIGTSAFKVLTHAQQRPSF